MKRAAGDRAEFVTAACGGKAGMTRRIAEAVARRMRQQDRAVATYHCPWCRLWHVGAKKPGRAGQT